MMPKPGYIIVIKVRKVHPSYRDMDKSPVYFDVQELSSVIRSDVRQVTKTCDTNAWKMPGLREILTR